MQFISSLEDFSCPKSVVTIGVFDGVHLGHQRVIRQTVNYAQEIKAKSVLLTFKPHPQSVVADKEIKLIASYEQKKQLIAELGIDVYNELSFIPSFASFAAEKFVKEFLVDRLAVNALVFGINYHLGRDKKGNKELIQRLGKKYGFEVIIVSGIKVGAHFASSTLIRSFIKAGDFQQASKFLGRDWQIEGKIFRGSQRGKTFGYPTANIDYSVETLLPKGVFVAEVILPNINKKEIGIVNIGTRPTFFSQAEKRKIEVEAHIFDFQKEIYGDKIKIILKHKIRNEQKFSGKEELIKQIKRDEKEARKEKK